MSVCRIEGESDHSDLTEDPLAESLVACMICRVADETLGFSEAVESAPVLPLGSLLESLPELQREPEARTQESR
tara:strand:+ start:621 stop:842 length:222 start_codon:yes stop_codon:yes gene_type:complete